MVKRETAAVVLLVALIIVSAVQTYGLLGISPGRAGGIAAGTPGTVAGRPLSGAGAAVPQQAGGGACGPG